MVLFLLFIVSPVAEALVNGAFVNVNSHVADVDAATFIGLGAAVFNAAIVVSRTVFVVCCCLCYNQFSLTSKFLANSSSKEVEKYA